jgi:hypothetical protein
MEISTLFILWRAKIREINKGRVERVHVSEKQAVRGTIDARGRCWRVVELPSGRMGAVGAENRSYEMQIAQKYPEVDGVGPNARRLAYGIKRHSACRSTAFLQHEVSRPSSLLLAVRMNGCLMIST